MPPTKAARGRIHHFDGWRLFLDDGSVRIISAPDVTQVHYWFRGDLISATPRDAPRAEHLLQNLRTGVRAYAGVDRLMRVDHARA